MPCFKGLAVSIHTPDGPLPEYSIQKQSRLNRITSYIPVPPAKILPSSNKPEQSTFCISITLLTPGLAVPYSTPKPGPDDPYPRPKVVGGLPGIGSDRGKYGPVVGPYVPMTESPNETIAAYIYFDGRAKEEVATLLRKGEETWVNSRWVSIPASEGGGLAERDFLFREVGLERWLNGLDLEGKDASAIVERRRQRLERKRRKKEKEKEIKEDPDVMEDFDGKGKKENGVLRYGADKNAPLESLSAEEGLFTSDSDSEDEPPMPEAAGQIKVALFRVLASGEIKKGEYSPQFDAHDDSDTQNENGDGSADVDHTTSFAKPKTLDPKTISTQTVTGIDAPERPYAVFTFLYRGERQLQKMGILASPEGVEVKSPTRRRNSSLNFSNLGALKKEGTQNFSGYRDATLKKSSTFETKKDKKKGPDDEMDSDADDEDEAKDNAEDTEEANGKDNDKGLLSPEDARRQEEMAEGVRKIKLKRQHSAEPVAPPPTSTTAKSTAKSPSPNASTPPASAGGTLNGALGAAPKLAAEPEAIVGSPFKKQRASLPGFEQGGLGRKKDDGNEEL